MKKLKGELMNQIRSFACSRDFTVSALTYGMATIDELIVVLGKWVHTWKVDGVVIGSEVKQHAKLLNQSKLHTGGSKLAEGHGVGEDLFL